MHVYIYEQRQNWMNRFYRMAGKRTLRQILQYKRRNADFEEGLKKME
jgi:hypothetical protein